jgi:hypothetical protein
LSKFDKLPGIFVTAFVPIFERLTHEQDNDEGSIPINQCSKSFVNVGVTRKGNTARSNLVLLIDYIEILLKESCTTGIKNQYYCYCKIEFCPNYAYLLWEEGLSDTLIQWLLHLKNLVSKSEYRFFITGSRDLFIEKDIKKVLANLYAKGINPKKMVMVVGDAKGVDATATKLWQKAGLRIEIYQAEWEEHGKKAGMLRNMAMLSSGVDYGYGFCKNNSKGTTGMLNLASEQGVPFERFDYS